MEEVKTLELVIESDGGERLVFQVKKLVIAGYTSRDQDQIRKHMEELKKEGIAGPNKIPAFCPKIPDRITTDDITVLADSKTSGEAEFVLLIGKDEIYVGIGSDHTDRELEKHSMLLSKQMYPCVISKKVWRYRDVKKQWDNILMRAWVDNKGQRQLYQETKLGKFMKPEELIEKMKEQHVKGDINGTVVYSGTVPVIGGEFIYSSHFEAELVDEQTKRSISCAYSIKPVTWFEGVIL